MLYQSKILCYKTENAALASAYFSRTVTSSADMMMSLFAISRVGSISERNVPNRLLWKVNIVGKIRNTIRPGVSTSGNFTVSRKSLSKVKIGNPSFFERSNSKLSGVPLGDQMTSWPAASATRVSGRDIFSSAKNFTLGVRKINHMLTFGAGCGKLQSSLDVLTRNGRPGVKYGLVALAVCKCVEHLPYHNPRSLEGEFTAANLRIGNDILVDNDSLHEGTIPNRPVLSMTSFTLCNNV